MRVRIRVGNLVTVNSSLLVPRGLQAFHAKQPERDRDMRLKRHSASAGTWRCDACGAFNDEPDTICSECSAQRIETEASSKQTKSKSKGAEKDIQDFEIPEAKAPYAEAIPEPSTLLDEPEKDEEEAKADEEPAEQETPVEEPQEPEPAPKLEPFKFEPQTPTFTPTFTAPTITPASGQSRYFFTFVSSPASSLVKSKVPIDFETFPTVTIGRSPENIIVLPDQEVSRKHAELTIDGNNVTLKDLGSKNGTFLYDGKKFQQVNDSVDVKPNSVIKFGTGTIVRLTSE